MNVFQQWLKETGRHQKGLLLCSGVALLLRILAGFELSAHDPAVLLPASGTDMQTYLQLTDRFLAGNFNEVFYFQPLYYTILLPLLKFVFGNVSTSLLIFHACLSALTVLLTAQSAGILFGRRTALVTALILTFYAPLSFFIPYILSETTLIFGSALLLRLWIHPIQPPLLVSAFSGLMTGLLILARGNFWLFLPVGIWAMRRNGSSRKSQAGYILLFTFSVLLPQIPYIVHNSFLEGRLCAATANAPGLVVFGNNPETAYGGIQSRASVAAAWQNTPSPIGLTAAWITAQPGAWFELNLRKMIALFSAESMPNNIGDENFQKSRLLVNAHFPQGILFLSGLIGICLFFVQKRSSWNDSEKCLALFGLCMLFALLPFPNCDRYRVIAAPLLALWGSFAFSAGFEILKTQKKRQLLILFLSAGMGYLWVFHGTSLYRVSAEKHLLRALAPSGVNARLNDREYLCKDNGSFVGGGWNPCSESGIGVRPREAESPPMTAGETLEQHFVIPEGYASSRITTVFYAPAPGFLAGSFNGQPFERALSPGLNILEFPFKTVVNRGVLKVKRVSRNIWWVADAQRNYGRSFRNGKVQDAAYVAEMRLFKESP